MNIFFWLTSSILFVLFLTPSAHANIVVLGDLTRDYKMKPGQTYEAMIELENRDSRLKKVQIYQTDYRYLASGDNFFPPAGTYKRSNAAWITYSPKIVSVPPGHRSQIKYLIRAPKDQTKSGTYWSMLMVQDVRELPSDDTGPNTLQLIPTFRYGVQIITQISNTGKIALEFTSVNVVNRKSKRFLVIDLENKGTRHAKSDLWVEVFNNKGEKVGRFITDPGRILPGCSIRREIDISSLPKGRYTSLVISDCGHKDVFGLELKLVLQ
jgi:hypothetical protein